MGVSVSAVGFGHSCSFGGVGCLGHISFGSLVVGFDNPKASPRRRFWVEMMVVTASPAQPSTG